MKYVKYSWESMMMFVAYPELHQKREETEGWVEDREMDKR